MATHLKVLEELAQPIQSWRETDVPLASRGVSRAWLVDFVARLQSELNGQTPEPASFSQPSPPFSNRAMPYQLFNTHALVKHVIKPLTEKIKAPLYALVPVAHRGPPQTFISHTWSSLLIGPHRQRIGTLDALRSGSKDEFVWIDFACYNQHLFESIAVDMAHLVAKIKSLSIVATPMPLFTRSWCLWELLSAYRANTRVDVRLESGWRNDKILAVNSLYRSFVGVANARSKSATDQQDIYRGFIDVFGSDAQADEAIRALIKDKFAAPRFELQDADQEMAFSAQPFGWGDTGTEAHGVPFFLPDLLDAQILGESRPLRDYLQSLDVLPAQGTGDVVYDSRQMNPDRSRAEVDAANAEMRARGESGRVEARTIDVNILPSADGRDRPTPNNTAIRMACPNCGAQIEVVNRPVYIESKETNSLWAKFVNGQLANTCVCGVGLGGRPSLFCTETWTAVTLEPPPGHSLPAHRFAELIEQLLGGHSVYPLLVFEHAEDLQAAVSQNSEFAVLPYVSLMLGDYAAPVRSLLLGALAVSSMGLQDLGYSILRNPCFQTRAPFFWFEREMRILAQGWDRQGRSSDLFQTALTTDLAALSNAMMNGLPKLAFGQTYFCSLATRSSNRDMFVFGARTKFGTGLRFAPGEIGKERCSIPASIIPVQTPDLLAVSKLDIGLIAAHEYLRNSRIKLAKDLRTGFQEAARRLEQAWESMNHDDRAKLEAQYNELGLRDLRSAVRHAR